MSIIIRSDELNLLVYRYLCEANLSHTAYSLYNQASLESTIAQYKYDMKPGQLLSVLQKGLIFNQIQSHVTINDYEQCCEPFYLIKDHTCKITQKIKKENEQLLNQLNDQIFTSMRRASSVHNALIPNKQYQDIIYEQRSTNYLERIPLKIRGIKNLQFGGSSDLIYAYDQQALAVSVIKKQQNQLNTQGVLPCFINGKLQKPIFIQLVDNILIRVYQGNTCQLTQIDNISNNEQESCQFKHFALFDLPLGNNCLKVIRNPKINFIFTFCGENTYCVINTNSLFCIANGEGLFQWKDASHYFIANIQNNKMCMKSLKQPELKQYFNAYLSKISNISISESGIYFFAQSKTQNKIFVYTLEKQEPLYIFNFGNQKNGSQMIHEDNQNHENHEDNQSSSQSTETQILKQCIWISNNSSDDLIILTENSIKIFGIQLNNYLKIVDISNYDKSVTKLAILRKDENQVLAVCLGEQNIIVYDIGLGKIQRIQYQKSQQQNQDQIYQFNGNAFVGIKINNSFYLARDKDFENLFL